MSAFYPVMHPVEVRQEGSIATIGDPEIGHVVFDEATRVATTEGHVYPPEDQERLQQLARSAGCVINVAENVEVNLGEHGVVEATPVTIRTDSTGASHIEAVQPFPSGRNSYLIRRHAAGVRSFMGVVAALES